MTHVRIAVLTPTIPERAEMLEECKASVRAQTLQPVEHLIELDEKRTLACGPQLNRMAKRTDCEWLATLADDDLLLPHHLETLAAHADEADVVYSYCEVTGRDWSPNMPYDPDADMPQIPATALIRRSLWEEVKWGKDLRAEDNDFWLRCQRKGARFVCVPEVTWVYRFHGHNKSLVPSHHDFWEGIP